MSIFERYSRPGIHPADLRDAVNARLKEALADSKRKARNPTTAEEVEQDLYVAWVAADPIDSWPDWLQRDVMNYAAKHGPQFLTKLNKALISKRKRSRWFDRLDIFILTNRDLRNKTRDQAVKILRKAGFTVSKDTYASRIKRLGLTR
jgi:hypothetical protein